MKAKITLAGERFHTYLNERDFSFFSVYNKFELMNIAPNYKLLIEVHNGGIYFESIYHIKTEAVMNSLLVCNEIFKYSSQVNSTTSSIVDNEKYVAVGLMFNPDTSTFVMKAYAPMALKDFNNHYLDILIEDILYYHKTYYDGLNQIIENGIPTELSILAVLSTFAGYDSNIDDDLTDFLEDSEND